MQCPLCGGKTKVIDSRRRTSAKYGDVVVRKRKCTNRVDCGYYVFATYEIYIGKVSIGKTEVKQILDDGTEI
jgi:transcriptional regulator NrdR family protein